MAETPEDLIVTDAELRRQLPTLAKELKIGGSGVEPVSGTVTLDPASGQVREVFATSAATVQGEKLAAGDIAAFRYASGVWQVRVLDKDHAWRNVGTAPTDPTPPSGLTAPTNVKASPTTTGATITWNAVSGADGYVLRMDGGTWADMGKALTYTVASQSAGSSHTVEVAAYKGTASAQTATSPASTVSYVVLGATLKATTDYLAADTGTAITSWSGGGLAWLAPISADTGVTGNATTLINQRTYSGTGGTAASGGSTLLDQDDACISVRYSMEVGATGQQVRLHARGSGAIIVLRGDGQIYGEGGIGVIATGQPITGTLSLAVVGGVGTVYVNGAAVGQPFSVVTASSRRWGFAAYGASSYVLSAKVEPWTTSSSAPSIATDPVTGVITSETFTGATADLGGTNTDAAAGGRPFTWLSSDAGHALTRTGGVGAETTLTGLRSSVIDVPVLDQTVTLKLAAAPNAGALRLVARRRINDAYGVAVRVQPTAITPVTGHTTAIPGATSFGTPQPGDVYTVSVKGMTATFTAKRADGSNIGAGTQTFTLTDQILAARYAVGVSAETGTTGYQVDDLIVKVAA